MPTSGTGVSTGPNGSDAPLVQNIRLGSPGSNSSNNNFASVRPASLAGHVYADIAPANGQRDSGESGIAGATVTLSGTDFLGRSVSTLLTTATDGGFSATGLLPGVYQLDETQPDGYADGPEHLGTVGGSARGTANPGGVNDRLGAIALASEEGGLDYDFGERLARVTVHVFEDANNDGAPVAGDAGITGVTLHLTGGSSTGTPVDITATPIAGQAGHYEFRNVPPSAAGGYTITETQPATYAPGKANVNGNPGSAQANGNVIQGVAIPVSGTPAVLGDYLFGELTGSEISGRSYYDRNGDGSAGAPASEPGIAGVAITLTGTDDNGNAVSVVTSTDANGDYVFNNVAPGTYTVSQARPTGYLPGLTRAGTVTGSGSVAGSVPTSGTGVSTG
ncbi:SdrD B-like domain-containing protein, partial [Pelomonas sp. Root1217]|uniref:SdrD B-like domain-containing protein n=1 Tax=Pelomonas sp. Root1217 TaxID=1736430 RepID=UPI00210151C4